MDNEKTYDIFAENLVCMNLIIKNFHLLEGSSMLDITGNSLSYEIRGNLLYCQISVYTENEFEIFQDLANEIQRQGYIKDPFLMQNI